MVETECAAFKRLVRARIRGLHRQLQVVHAGIVVSAAALHHQNADRDLEIARVLRHCAGDRLSDQIQRTAELLATLQPRAADASDLAPEDRGDDTI